MEYTTYFAALKDYRSAADWQKDMILRSSLLKLCNTIEPVNLRHRLRRFWTEQVALRGLNVEQLQTWS